MRRRLSNHAARPSIWRWLGWRIQTNPVPLERVERHFSLIQGSFALGSDKNDFDIPPERHGAFTR